jgi:D-alanine-D-alanine ligase
MGGFSSEKEISRKSGKNVYETLKKGGYNVFPVDVDYDLIEVLKKEKFDLLFNVLHGEFGEDGRIQAILDFLKIPYTGAGMEASQVGMNKILSKELAKLNGVPTPAFEKYRSVDQSVSFPLPWVVKPIMEGSSIGVYIIKNQADLSQIDFNDGKEYFVEEYVQGIEVTVGVLDNGEEAVVLPVLQLVPHNEFYDFEAKYTKGMTDFILPAQIPEDMTKKVKDYALMAHRSLGCLGASRSDFIIRGDEAYFLEINTSPGMTETSDIPAQAKSYGMSDLELCEKILESALARMA